MALRIPVWAIAVITIIGVGLVTVLVLWATGVFKHNETTDGSGGDSTNSPNSPNQTNSSDWKIQYEYNFDKGDTLEKFQNDFELISTEVNEGNAAYVTDKDTKLVSVHNKQLVLKLGDVGDSGCSQAGTNQCIQSIKYQSTFKLSPNTMIVLKASQIPHALALWPAWWLSVQPNDWPQGGEIDIIESVNAEPTGNLCSLHTGPNCDIPNAAKNGSSHTSSNCNDNNGYDGCGVSHPNHLSSERGTYAMVWVVDKSKNEGSIKFYWWDYGDTNADSDTGPNGDLPDNSKWGDNLYGNFVLDSSCTPDHFSEQNVILNTEVCGNWAGTVFPSGGQSACSEYVKKINPSDPSTQWHIDHIRILSGIEP